MKDPIERQAAIDAANDWLLDCLNVKKQDRSCGLIRRLEDLPPAQPEITRCKDCVHYYGEPGNPNIICFQMHENDFCSYGEGGGKIK